MAVQRIYRIVERFNDNEVRVADKFGRRFRTNASINEFKVGQRVVFVNGIIRGVTDQESVIPEFEV